MKTGTYYTLSPIFYRGGNYLTGDRLNRKERQALYTKARECLAHGCDTTFKTKQAATIAMRDAGLSKDDFDICETSDWII